jgi:hypothetical protein
MKSMSVRANPVAETKAVAAQAPEAVPAPAIFTSELGGAEPSSLLLRWMLIFQIPLGRVDKFHKVTVGL